MSGIISGLAAQYGRHLVCYDENGRVTGEGEAFFQPLTERQWQRSAGALGAYSTDQFLCLAPAGLPLGEPGDGGWVECDGTLYQPIAVHPIPIGDEVRHLWAVLERRAEDAL